nr:hypothetical protein [Pedobacter panaciterrae]
MMYELGLLTHFVNEKLTTNHLVELEIDTQKLQEYEELIIAETKRIRNKMKEIVSSDRSEAKIIRYVRQHQLDITCLCDEIHLLRGSLPNGINLDNDLRNNVIKLHNLLSSQTIALLLFIFKYFKRYSDPDIHVPLAYQQIIFEKEFLRIRQVYDRISELQIQPQLVRPLKFYLISSLRNRSISWNNIKYLKKLIGHILNALSKDRCIDWNAKIIVMLMYLNFNNLEFYMEVRRWIRNQLLDEEEISGKLKILNSYLNYIQQFLVHPELIEKQNRDSLKVMIEGFIRTEIAELEHTNQNLSIHSASKDIAIETLPISISVPQLGYLIRLLVRGKVFLVNARKPKKLLQFISKWITTAGTNAKMSFGHLKNEYYDPKKAAALALRAILLRLIEMINKDLETKL